MKSGAREQSAVPSLAETAAWLPLCRARDFKDSSGGNEKRF